MLSDLKTFNFKLYTNLSCRRILISRKRRFVIGHIVGDKLHFLRNKQKPWHIDSLHMMDCTFTKLPFRTCAAHLRTISSSNVQNIFSPLKIKHKDSTWREQFFVPLPPFYPVFTIVIYGWESVRGTKYCCRQVLSTRHSRILQMDEALCCRIVRTKRLVLR